MTSRTPINRGEVWLLRFPFTDLSSAKVRPAIVWAIYGDDVIVLGIFSRVPSGTLPNTWVVIETGTSDFTGTGLAKTSVVKTEKIAVVHRSLFQRKLGQFRPSLMSQVAISLKKALNLR